MSHYDRLQKKLNRKDQNDDSSVEGEPPQAKKAKLDTITDDELEIFKELTRAPPKKKKRKKGGKPPSNEKLREECRWNRQSSSGDKKLLVVRCLDGRLRGRLGLCPKCIMGKLFLQDDQAEYVICKGYLDDDTMQRVKCDNVILLNEAPRFQPWYHQKRPTMAENKEMDEQEVEAVEMEEDKRQVKCKNDANADVFEIASELNVLYLKQEERKKQQKTKQKNNSAPANGVEGEEKSNAEIWSEILLRIGASKRVITASNVKRVLSLGNDRCVVEAVEQIIHFLNTGKVSKQLSTMRLKDSFGVAATCVKQQIKAYERGDIPGRWWFENYHPPTDIIDDENLELIFQGYFKLVVYFRALDRCPGGNIDAFTLRLTIESDNEYMQGTLAHNYDGSLSICGYNVKAPDAEMMDTVKQLILDQESKNAEFHILDTKTRDSNEYDTEWSSIEVLVFDGQPLPLMRLHQRCVMGEQNGAFARNKETVRLRKNLIEGTDEQQELVATITDMLGMDRPVHFQCDGACDGWKQFNKAEKLERKGGDTNFEPISFPYE